jgi:hypothetical protein
MFWKAFRGVGWYENKIEGCLLFNLYLQIVWVVLKGKYAKLEVLSDLINRGQWVVNIERIAVMND